MYVNMKQIVLFIVDDLVIARCRWIDVDKKLPLYFAKGSAANSFSAGYLQNDGLHITHKTKND